MSGAWKKPQEQEYFFETDHTSLRPLTYLQFQNDTTWIIYLNNSYLNYT